MVFNSEEQARKISLNALIGVPSDEFNDSISLDQDWISIDEGEDDNYHQVSKNDETIARLQLENRNLKKKLKDIELGHDSNSIVANDEHYTRLENQYNELSQNFDLMECETNNLIEQNDAYFKEMTRLKEELSKINNSNKILTELLNKTIESAPIYITEKSNFVKLFSPVKDSNIPISISNTFQKSLDKYTSNVEKNGDNNDLIKMLQFEVRNLKNTNKLLHVKIKTNDNLNAKKISLERRTIIVAAMQNSLHNEFQKSQSNKPTRWFNKIPTIDIVPSHESVPSPLTPISHSMHSLNSIISKSTDHSEHNATEYSSIKSPLDIQYETFT